MGLEVALKSSRTILDYSFSRSEVISLRLKSHDHPGSESHRLVDVRRRTTSFPSLWIQVARVHLHFVGAERGDPESFHRDILTFKYKKLSPQPPPANPLLPSFFFARKCTRFSPGSDSQRELLADEAGTPNSGFIFCHLGVVQNLSRWEQGLNLIFLFLSFFNARPSLALIMFLLAPPLNLEDKLLYCSPQYFIIVYEWKTYQPCWLLFCWRWQCQNETEEQRCYFKKTIW